RSPASRWPPSSWPCCGLGTPFRSRARQELRWVWPGIPDLHRCAVEPARIAAWRQGELLPDAGTASRRVEGLRVGVLFEYPQVQARRGRPFDDGLRDQAQQAGPDAASRQSMCHMEVVEEGAPG